MPTPMTVNLRDDGILVFTFSTMDRQAVKAFVGFMEEREWKYPKQAFMLWDFRQAGMPVRYFTQSIERLFSEHPRPASHVNAYVVKSQMDTAWIHLIQQRIKSPDTSKTFIDYDEALTWLHNIYEQRSSGIARSNESDET